jgi:hypothetical protein
MCSHGSFPGVWATPAFGKIGSATAIELDVGEREPEQRGDTTGMKIEILHFDNCPTYRATENTLRHMLAEEGIEADIELVAVNSDEETRRLRFPGSPTVRVDGCDLFPTPECEDWRLVCQVYATPEGLIGSPTAQMLKVALPKLWQ